ncbi:MAG: hypothetical protein DWP97_04670, partial [Calditrichaeota bacterium]
YKLHEKDIKALDPLGYPVTIPNDDVVSDIKAIPLYFHNVFRKIPAWLELIRYVAGDSVFNPALQQTLEKYAFQSVSSDEFVSGFSNNLNIKLLSKEYLHNLLADVDSIDFTLENTKIEQKKDSSYISGEIISNTMTILPLDIAFIDIRNDTLYKKIYPEEFQNRKYNLSEVIVGKVKLIILNPNFTHNELTRSNNYYSVTPQKFNMQEPGWFFLGFRPF